jgi:sugar lactone lactonase YvrE
VVSTDARIAASDDTNGSNPMVSKMEPSGWVTERDEDKMNRPESMAISPVDGSLYVTASQCIWRITNASVGSIPLGPTPTFVEAPEEPESAGQIKDIAGVNNSQGCFFTAILLL